MPNIRITVGDLVFIARMEEKAAPKSCAAFLKLLPYHQKIIQARWSGEAAWIPLGDYKFDVDWETPISYPSPGEILLYPGGISETELLLPYGHCSFASKAGTLAGNHFLTIIEGNNQLAELGRLVLWQGAQDITFEAI